jgi:hypothetical protein
VGSADGVDERLDGVAVYGALEGLGAAGAQAFVAGADAVEVDVQGGRYFAVAAHAASRDAGWWKAARILARWSLLSSGAASTMRSTRSQ